MLESLSLDAKGGPYTCRNVSDWLSRGLDHAKGCVESLMTAPSLTSLNHGIMSSKQHLVICRPVTCRINKNVIARMSRGLVAESQVLR